MEDLWLILIVLVASFFTSQVSAEENFQKSEETLRRFKRIVNGEVVRNGDWPWLVHLKADVSYKVRTSWWSSKTVRRSVRCGGSIVDNRWVMTAAHCLDDDDEDLRRELQTPNEWHITAGEVDWKCNNYIRHWWGRIWGRPSQRCNIHASKIVTHPDYKKGGLYYWANDIALMKLEDNILEKDNTEVIPPCDLTGQSGEFPKEGDTGYVHGWGCSAVDLTGGSPSSSAQNAAIGIRSNTYCRSIFTSTYNTSAHLCAGGYGSSVCNGDSGGPLVVNHPSGGYCQAGVVSFFLQREPTTKPSGFARVSTSHNWIREVIRNG